MRNDSPSHLQKYGTCMVFLYFAFVFFNVFVFVCVFVFVFVLLSLFLFHNYENVIFDVLVTARRRQAPPHLRSSPTSNQVCGALLQEENSGQPVAIIECLGGCIRVIMHYCPLSDQTMI